MSTPTEELLVKIAARVVRAVAADAELRQSLRELWQQMQTPVAAEDAPPAPFEGAEAALAKSDAPAEPVSARLPEAAAAPAAALRPASVAPAAPVPVFAGFRNPLEPDPAAEPRKAAVPAKTTARPEPGGLQKCAASMRKSAEIALQTAQRAGAGDIELPSEWLNAPRAKQGAAWLAKAAAHAQPGDGGRWAILARSYGIAAEAADLLAALIYEGAVSAAVEQALDLAAEAQSALRVAVAALHKVDDPDQFAMYDWLRGFAEHQRYYIERYMRSDDRADPARGDRLLGRLRSLSDERSQRREYGKAIKRARYHARALQDGKSADSRLHDWTIIAKTLNELVLGGQPPSSTDFRDLLLPIVDGLPEIDGELPGFDRVLREIDRYVASRPSQAAAQSEPEAESGNVVQVRQWLESRTAVLIGGEPRPAARAALERAFGLERLDWLYGPEHSSVYEFEPYVRRESVAVVLLAIRWSSHGFNQVREFCDTWGKPLVYLPAGYNPEQVAHQIVEQAGARLEAAA